MQQNPTTMTTLHIMKITNQNYRSYPGDDNYEKSYDKSNQNSSVTENDCININNINVDNTENINAGSNSDGVSQQQKTKMKKD